MCDMQACCPCKCVQYNAQRPLVPDGPTADPLAGAVALRRAHVHVHLQSMTTAHSTRQMPVPCAGGVHVPGQAAAGLPVPQEGHDGALGGRRARPLMSKGQAQGRQAPGRGAAKMHLDALCRVIVGGGG